MNAPPSLDEFGELLNDDNASVALSLANRGFAVAPMRDWRGEGEWTPIKNWPELATADAEQIRSWWRRWPDARIALLCGSRNGLTVLDIDRKSGKDGLASLARLGFDNLDQLSPVRVRTPSGGYHVFFRYDPRLKNWAGKIGVGIDIRNDRGFVVAPGSFKNSSRYEVLAHQLGECDLPAFPAELIPPPEPDREGIEPIADPAENQIAWATAILEQRAATLGATREGSRNCDLNDCAMWAGGAAAHGFIDEDHAKTALISAGVSAGLKKREAVSTFKSGFAAGLRKPITDFPIAITDDDFDDLPQLDATVTHGTSASVDDDEIDSLGVNPVTRRLNNRHAVVVVRGRTLILTEHNGNIDFGDIRGMHTLYANDLVVKPGEADKLEASSMRWLRDPDRRTYPDGVTFAPAGCEQGVLNLWRGWSVEPDPAASCQFFLQHLRTVICCSDADQYRYLIGWLAHMVQRPEEKPGVALVLRGPKGAGKDTVADYLAAMIGRRHAPTVADSRHIVGNFNARLESALLLHVQEGSWAGDRKAEGVLKYLVTSEHIEIERKGIDSINLPSVLRLFISANADWVVPASADERRWAVFEVSGSRRADQAYFAALRAEMQGRGPAALLHYLREYDLSGFNVRSAPATEGLRNQKLASLRNIEAWWLEALACGDAPGSIDGNWEESFSVNRDVLRRNYIEWMRERRFAGEVLDMRQFGQRLREMLPGLTDKRSRCGGMRAWNYVLPMLDACRAEFEAWIGHAVTWDDN